MFLAKETSQTLYIARALGIILVVIGHYMWHPNWTWSPYIFHMPLFFFMGGITAKPFTNISTGVKKLTDELIIYYIRWYLIIAALTWFITQIWQTSIVFNLGSGVDSLLFPLKHNSHNNSLFMVGWFIIAYFFTSLSFKAILSWLEPITSKTIILTVGLILGVVGIEVVAPLYHTNKLWVINIISQVCVGLMYFSIGYWLRDQTERITKLQIGMIASIFLLSLVYFGIAHELGMSWSQYPDGFALHLTTSLLGILATLSLAKKLNETMLKNHLVMIGKFSKSIMTLHMLWLVISGLCLGIVGIVDISEISALQHKVSVPLSIFYIGIGLYGSLITALIMRSGSNKIRYFLSVK